MATEAPRLFHGGVPGLRPGDLIEPGHKRGPKRRAIGLHAPRVDPPSLRRDVVYLTPSRLYAAFHAHVYPRGDVYRVEPVGRLDPSSEDYIETFTAKSARVVAAVERAVVLSASDERRFTREYLRAQGSERRSTRLDEAQTAELVRGGLFAAGPAGMRPGSRLDGSATITNSLLTAEGEAAMSGGVAYQVRPVGPLKIVRRGSFVLGMASACEVVGLATPLALGGAA